MNSMWLTLTFITKTPTPHPPPLPDQHYWLPQYHCRHCCVDLLALQPFWSPSLAPSLHPRSFHGGPHCFLSFIQLTLQCLLCLTPFVSQIILLFLLLSIVAKNIQKHLKHRSDPKTQPVFKTALNNLCRDSETLSLLILIKKKYAF